MNIKRSFVRTAGVALLVGMTSLPLAAQDDEPVFGQQLMTQQELREHRQTMRGFNTNEERAQYRELHRERMLERARERGVELGNGPGQGMSQGQGAGQGQGMGQGQGQGQGQGNQQG
ncbi:hypothetical protein, partial [Marinobacter segnicrescens]|uniref:hypothetical protein n=2 Tax=Marinobacter TaxID=2742 RepID=UPI003A8EA413